MIQHYEVVAALLKVNQPFCSLWSHYHNDNHYNDHDHDKHHDDDDHHHRDRNNHRAAPCEHS